MRPLRSIVLAAGLGIPAAGCGGSDLAQEWQLDRLRVLAVRATPAEPRPGDTVTFERLLYVPPETTLETVTWFGCLPDGSIGFGCEFDPSILDAFADLDFASATPEELAELFAALEAAGFIGAEPGFAPTWQAPEDALEGLSDSQRQEGRNAIVNITAVPSENAADDTELALKRVPVSENDTPNTNPNVLEGYKRLQMQVANNSKERTALKTILRHKIRPLVDDVRRNLSHKSFPEQENVIKDVDALIKLVTATVNAMSL